MRALARLNHPNILTVYDYGQDGDLLYLIMELSGRDRLEIMGRIGGLESLNRFKAAAFEILQAYKQPDCFHFPVRATLTLATKQR